VHRYILKTSFLKKSSSSFSPSIAFLKQKQYSARELQHVLPIDWLISEGA